MPTNSVAVLHATHNLPHKPHTQIMQSTISRLTASIATVALLLGLALPTTSQAQQTQIGFKGGVAQSTFYGDDVGANDFRPGFSGGITLTYPISEQFAIQPEVLYARRGAKNHFSETGNAALDDELSDIRVRHDVIEVPVLFKLSAPTAPVTPRIYAGPYLGIIPGAEIDGESAGGSFSDVDFGGVVGGEIAYEFDIPGVLSAVVLDGRYNLGLADLGDTGDFEEVSTSAFTGTLSLRFDI